ncbi:MAG: glycosyltransferase family 39 protein [Chloroflexi bacterium]|nr:glycosyltransferase family 39 protein [Chloroflexota bacterium]
MLSTVVVDKPPLPFYLMAAGMSAFGGAEFAARVPTLFASIVSIALLYALGRTLYDRRTAALGALALALSPLAILFAITLFTDTLLAAFVLWALLMAARGRWRLAGLAVGLAFACKQTALFLVPLVLAVGAIQFIHHGEHREHGDNKSISVRSVLSVVNSFLWPALLCAAAVFLWDALRHAPISFWVQGYTDNNPGRLVRANEIWPRLAAWADLFHTLTGSRLAEAALIAGLLVLFVPRRRSRAALHDHTLAAFTLAFLGGYWLLAFNVWDRYLVVLAPVVALLLGRVIAVVSGQWIVGRGQWAVSSDRWAVVSDLSSFCTRHFSFSIVHHRIVSLFIVSLFIASLSTPALVAARSGYPVGGDHGAYDGIDEIAETLHTVPAGSVLYDHWLSWELGFYLFDGPAYLAWMPGPDALADDLRAFGRSSPRYIVAPSWESFTEMQTAIEAAGFKLEIMQTANRRDGTLSFTLYRIWPK